MDILLTDDESGLRGMLEETLTGLNHRVTSCEDGQKGLALAQKHRFDLAVVDIFMPNMDGLELIQALHRTQPALPIIAMSGVRYALGWSLAAAEEFGAVHVLQKPFRIAEFVQLVEHIAAGRATQDNAIAR